MFDQTLAQKAAENLKRVREKKPLVHNITNYVVMNYTANALLACGASPVMAHALEEVEEMVALAGALVLNIGTLSLPWIEAMLKAGKRANALKDPGNSGSGRFGSHQTAHGYHQTDHGRNFDPGASRQCLGGPLSGRRERRVQPPKGWILFTPWIRPQKRPCPWPRI